MRIDRTKNPRPYKGIQEARPCNYYIQEEHPDPYADDLTYWQMFIDEGYMDDVGDR